VAGLGGGEEVVDDGVGGVVLDGINPDVGGLDFQKLHFSKWFTTCSRACQA
jgi:hypothetical protein